MPAALTINGIAKRFGETTAVRHVTLDVAPGEVFGLVGPDGAGKTTTMRMVAGLVTPEQGAIRLLGYDLATELFEVRARVGYMPQHYSLYGDLSVQENLRFFAGMYGVSKADMLQRERRLLGIARLEEFRDRPAAALSGGMYKKLALSCALIHSPRFLLLDEPTNGVDPISRRELWAFLGELVGEGVGVLISTPYMDEAERCDRVGLLVDGQLIALDSPAALKDRFDATVLEVTTDAPLTAGLFDGAPGVDEVYTVGRRIHVVTRAREACARELTTLARAAGAHARIERVAPSFEDIFMSLSAVHTEERTS